jgi:hypothetical protein
MENRLLSFSEFESVYESYGFVNESGVAEKPTFTPDKLEVSSDDLLSIFGGDDEKQNEAEKVNPFTIIKKGETGTERVKELQKELGLKATGNFDDATDKAVRDFQKTNKLTVDGKVGVETLTKILELKGVKEPQKVIQTKYVIIKTKDDAKKTGINPLLLEIYDVTIVNNGRREYVILIPKANSQKKAEKLIADGKGAFDWVKGTLNSVGKAFVYLSTGVFLVTLEMAKAIISGIISATKFIVGVNAYALGATVQGLALLGKWMKEKGQQAYVKASTAANDLWKSICDGFAFAVGKTANAVAALAAFVNGVVSVAKTTGYVLTGIAVTTWKGLSKALSPVANGIVQAAKDGKAFIASSGEWIAKNFKDGAKAFGEMISQGWQSAKQSAVSAYGKSKKALSSAGDDVVNAAKSAADSIGTFLSAMYNAGKAAWESEASEFFGEEIFETEIFVWPSIDFSIVE